MTAIAAVIALSATPALGQEVEPSADTTAETTTYVPPPSSDPLAPESPASEAASTPVEEPAAETSAAASEETPAATPAPTTRRTTRAPARAAGNALPAAADPATESAPAPSAASVAAAPADMIAPPLPISETGPTQPAIDAEEALPYAGAGIGLLALLGAGVAMRRRKRRHEAEEWDETVVDMSPKLAAASPEPRFVRQPAEPRHDTVPAVAPAATATAAAPAGVRFIGPRSKLPEGFDLSRFGRHVQLAYMGPTEDNPSFSLRNRLRRAAAIDQRERVSAEAGRPAEARPAPVVAKQQPMFSQFGQGVTYRRAGEIKAVERRPAFQS